MYVSVTKKNKLKTATLDFKVQRRARTVNMNQPCHYEWMLELAA
jgi:hypothetical protein